MTRWVRRAQGRGTPWAAPASCRAEHGEGGLAAGAPPQVIPWGTSLWWAPRGSELIVVTCQVLAVIGGLAAHEHVPVAQDLSLTQTPVLGGRSEVSKDNSVPCM